MADTLNGVLLVGEHLELVRTLVRYGEIQTEEVLKLGGKRLRPAVRRAMQQRLASIRDLQALLASVP